MFYSFVYSWLCCCATWTVLSFFYGVQCKAAATYYDAGFASASMSRWRLDVRILPTHRHRGIQKPNTCMHQWLRGVYAIKPLPDEFAQDWTPLGAHRRAFCTIFQQLHWRSSQTPPRRRVPCVISVSTLPAMFLMRTHVLKTILGCFAVLRQFGTSDSSAVLGRLMK